MVTANPIFLITFLARVSHSGKELYRRFLSIPGTIPNPSQGGDLDMGADPDIEIVQEDVRLPHLECLCLHLGDHTRDNDDVNHVSIFNHRLPSLLYVYLGRVRKERSRYGHRHTSGRPRRSESNITHFRYAHECSNFPPESPH